MSYVLNVMATVFTVKNNSDTSRGRDLFKPYTMSMTKSNTPKKMEITIIQNIDKNITLEITEHPPILDFMIRRIFACYNN